MSSWVGFTWESSDAHTRLRLIHDVECPVECLVSAARREGYSYEHPDSNDVDELQVQAQTLLTRMGVDW